MQYSTNIDHRKVFLGGFPVKLGPKDFFDYMKQFGEIENWRLVIHNKKSKGYGFVTYADINSAMMARSWRHEFGAKLMECKSVFTPDFSKHYKLNAKRRKIFVGKVPVSYKESDLEKLFSRFGKIDRVTINRDHTSNQSRGSGFVLFAHSESAAAAIHSSLESPIKALGKTLLIRECLLEQELLPDKSGSTSRTKDKADSLATSPTSSENSEVPRHRWINNSQFPRLSLYCFRDDNYRVNFSRNCRTTECINQPQVKFSNSEPTFSYMQQSAAHNRTPTKASTM